MKYIKILFVVIMCISVILGSDPVPSYGATITGEDNYGVSDNYNALPASIRDKFDVSGWQVHILPSDQINALYGAPKGCTVGGFTDYDTHEIYINASKKYSKCIYHEIGHWVDEYYINKGNYLYTSSSPEFTAIFIEEGKNYTRYGSVDSSEFFAEIFCGIQTGSIAAFKGCPNAVAYVQNVINNF